MKRGEGREAMGLLARLIELQPVLCRLHDESPLLMLERDARRLLAQLLVGSSERGTDVGHRGFAILAALQGDLGAEHERVWIAGQRLAGRRGLLRGFAGGRARRRQ
jgi:hypothetical protein